MRIIIQRVIESSVTVEGKVVGQVGRGLMLLVGLNKKDTEESVNRWADKVLTVRLWDQILPEGAPEDAKPKRWTSNVVQNSFGILVVSQFTLYSKMKGTKPDFHDALEGELARGLFDKFVARLRSKYLPEKVQTGAFGEMMDVHIRNDGPVTLIWDSDKSAGEAQEETEMSEKS